MKEDIGNVNEFKVQKLGLWMVLNRKDSLIVNENVFQNLLRTVKQVMQRSRLWMPLRVW